MPAGVWNSNVATGSALRSSTSVNLTSSIDHIFRDTDPPSVLPVTVRRQGDPPSIPRVQPMDVDMDKIDEAALALLFLTLDRDGRGRDWIGRWPIGST